jgi:hypothetical protein
MIEKEEPTPTPEITPPVAPPEITSSVVSDTGKTAKIYSNQKGIISQPTTLRSTDGLVNVSFGMGIAAMHSSGNPLSSISITQIPVEDLSAGSPGAALSFTGMAYNLQPDGATFNPPIPLSFTVPQADWEGEYVVQEYDTTTGTWLALPGNYNPETGIITVQVSHFCCFALFSKPKVIEEIKVTEDMPSPTPTIILWSKPQMMLNAEMFLFYTSMISNNPAIIVIILAAFGAIAYFGWWKRRL